MSGSGVWGRKVQPGDLVLTSGRGELSSWIRAAQTPLWKPDSMVSHTAVVTTWSELGDAWVVEALARVRHHRLAERYAESGTVVGVFRMRSLTVAGRNLIAKEALGYMGRRYGWWKLLLHLGDYLVPGDHYLFRRLGNMDRYPICSWLTARAYWHGVRYRFNGAPAGAASPEDHVRDVLDHPERWWTVVPFQVLEMAS